jgi:hypothetical protein
MSRNRDLIFQITAATAVIAALSAMPASATEVAAGPDETTSTEVAVAANDVREVTKVPSSMAVPLPQRRPKTVRIAPAPAARPVAVSHHDWNCSSFWCGRQFVLMLGIGY